jgi:hypothetical protein
MAGYFCTAILPSLMQSAYSHAPRGIGGGDLGQRANLLPFQAFLNPPSTTEGLAMMWLLIGAFAFGIFVLWKNRAKKKLRC